MQKRGVFSRFHISTRIGEEVFTPRIRAHPRNLRSKTPFFPVFGGRPARHLFGFDTRAIRGATKGGKKETNENGNEEHVGPNLLPASWAVVVSPLRIRFRVPSSALRVRRLRRHTKSDQIKVKMNFCSEKGPENHTG